MQFYNKNIKPKWDYLTGRSEQYALEARIYHTVCVLSMGISLCNATFNFIIGNLLLTLLMAVVFIFLLFVYYYARFKKRLNSSIILFGVTGNLLFAINYYFNAGIHGPGLLVFMIFFFLLLAVAPKKQYTIWLMLNIIIVIGLLITGYFNPTWIKDNYVNRIDRFVDFGYTYLVIVFLVLLIRVYMHNSYYEQQENLQKKALELEKSNETKNKLLSVLAHDLRSPLISIQGYLEILSRNDLPPDEKLSMEQLLLDNTKDTEHMLSNLLSWTRSQMDGVAVNLKVINLKDALAVHLHLQRSIAKEKGIELKNEIITDVFVFADANMLQLVMRNVLSNAIKFTLPGGSIIITTCKKGDEISIVIKDTGIGIADNQQNGVFSLKVKSTFGTQNEKGAGLGLVLCKEFTELQNGRISFESMPKQGTTFYITLKSGSPK